MKSSIFKLLMLVAIGALFFTSCEDENSSGIINSESITENETIALIETDDIADEVDNVIDDFLKEDLTLSSKEIASKGEGIVHGGRPDCVTKTVDEEENTKVVTLDFGDGCELPNGHILAGRIILSYTHDLDAETIIITKSFDGFSFNDVTVEGGNTIVRVRENENGNPQSTKTFNVVMTWPDGEFVTKEGTKSREWVEGFETRTWGDNIYLITGNWTATFKDGTVCSASIVEDLRREMACRFIVSGIIEFTKDGLLSSLNFGDGTCDNMAIFTDSEDVESEIVLKRRKHKNN